MDKFIPQKVLKISDELTKKRPQLEGKTFFYQEKIDGWYVSITYNPITKQWNNPVSSAGREIPSLTWMSEYLTETIFCPNIPIVLEAEAWQDMPFAQLNGLLNRSKGDCHFKDVILCFHNMFLPNKPNVPARERYNLLGSLLTTKDSTLKSKHIEKLPILLEEEFNKTNFDKLCEKIILAGGEGIVGRNFSGIYAPGKRNADIIKDKLECTVDTKVIRIEEGIGEKGNPSYTIVSVRKNGTEIRTVMSKHEDIANYILNPNNFIGKIALIKAMEEYENGQLRQPVFKQIRSDKGPEDYD